MEKDSIPAGAELEIVEEKFVEKIDFITGYHYLYWWKINENTLIGDPYKKEATSSAELQLSDFEIIEVNLENQTVKVLYKVIR